MSDQIRSGLFGGWVFCLSLTSETLQAKKEITELIKKNGGQIQVGISKQTTHFVTTPEEIKDVSFKVKQAYKQGCHVVLSSFVFDCVRFGQRVKEWNHTILGTTPASRLASDDTQLVLSKFGKAVGNIMGVMAHVSDPHVAVRKALHNVAGLCAGLLLDKSDTDPISKYNAGKIGLQDLVSRTHEALNMESDENAWDLFGMENDDNNNDNYHSSNNNDNNNTLTSRFSSSSHSRAQKRPFTTNKWTSGSSFLSHDLDHNPDQVGASSDLVGAVSSSFTYRSNRFKNPLSSATRGTSSYSSYSNDSGSVYEKKEKGSFLEQANQKRKEREDKMQQKLAEQQKKQEEKMQRLLEQQRQAQERKEKYEADKRQREERRQEVMKQLEERSSIYSPALSSFDNDNNNSSNNNNMTEHEEAMIERQYMEKGENPFLKQKEEQEAQRKAAEKAAKKQKKQEKKLQRLEELKKQYQEKVEERKKKKSEDKQKRQEEEAKTKEQKEIARKEYQQRHKRKEEKAQREAAAAAAQGTKPGAPQPPQPKPSFDDRKLFVGGITWDDLEKKHKLDPARAQEVRKQRIGYFWEIFEKFGVVVKKKDFILSKRHCFVTYADKDAFEKAFETLSKHEERQKLALEIRQRLREEAGGKKEAGISAPTSHFYVRKVNSVTTKQDKGEKGEKGEKGANGEKEGKEGKAKEGEKGEKKKQGGGEKKQQQQKPPQQNNKQGGENKGKSRQRRAGAGWGELINELHGSGAECWTVEQLPPVVWG